MEYIIKISENETTNNKLFNKNYDLQILTM